jgi:hypothetical protein
MLANHNYSIMLLSNYGSPSQSVCFGVLWVSVFTSPPNQYVWALLPNGWLLGLVWPAPLGSNTPTGDVASSKTCSLHVTFQTSTIALMIDDYYRTGERQTATELCTTVQPKLCKEA